jgi:hypothetical protein
MSIFQEEIGRMEFSVPTTGFYQCRPAVEIHPIGCVDFRNGQPPQIKKLGF